MTDRRYAVQRSSRQKETKKGSIAQLVQSVCLTSRGSGVRLPLLPPVRNKEECSAHLKMVHICKSLIFKRFNKSINSRYNISRHTCSSETALQALVGHIRYCRCALKCDTWKRSVTGIYLLTMSYTCHPTTGVPSKGWKSLAAFRQPLLSLSPTPNVNYVPFLP